MFRISLINMPFAALQRPSIALTQLKSVVESKFQQRVFVEIHYLNQDFGHYFDLNLYSWLAFSSESQNSGLGDWFFRQSAFADLPDNAETYFQRYFPYHTEQFAKIKGLLMNKRQGLDDYLDELIDRHQLNEANIVGFTSMFAQNVASFALARRIKRRNPNVIVIVGGANCETPMGQELVTHIEQVDYVFSGPALKSFPEFVGFCLDGEMDKCATIKGVFAKTRNTLPLAQAAIGEELDINVPVALDYDQFLSGVEKNFPDGEVKPVLMFETSRGCWWGERAHCTFCGLNGLTMNYRAMKPENAIALISSLFRYASTCSSLESVDNILPKSYLTDVFPYLATPSNMILFYEVKADLNEEEVQTLAKARVKWIQPGIEALATSTLKLMKKGTSSFQNIMLLKNCRLYDIFPAWNLLIGFPGEEEEVYRRYVEHIPLLTHLPPPSGAYPVRFDRYSPYFMQARQYELDLHPMDYYQLIYPFGEASLANLAYYFTDRNYRAPYLKSMSKWVSKIREKVDLWLAQWNVQSLELRPQLYLKENGASAIVYDSRAGKPVEHKISEVTRQVLELLNKPKRIGNLASSLSHIADFEPAQEIANLQQKGWVFQEHDRYLSLVLPKAPPPMTLRY
jgi:ribosomal peptide maturation radical SAM protein 1